MENVGDIHLLTVGERFWMLLSGCNGDHNWSFPLTVRDWRKIYAGNPPYDSHQTCPKCGATRLFDSKKMESGPMFVQVVDSD